MRKSKNRSRICIMNLPVGTWMDSLARTAHFMEHDLFEPPSHLERVQKPKAIASHLETLDMIGSEILEILLHKKEKRKNRDWPHMTCISCLIMTLKSELGAPPMIPFDTYELLLTFHSNYCPILFHFRYKVKYWLKIAIFHTTPAFDALVRGFPSEYWNITWYIKTKMASLPDSEGSLRIF